MEDVVVRREERGLISVLTMEYRPYNLLGPTLIGAIANEITGGAGGRQQGHRPAQWAAPLLSRRRRRAVRFANRAGR